MNYTTRARYNKLYLYSPDAVTKQETGRGRRGMLGVVVLEQQIRGHRYR